MCQEHCLKQQVFSYAILGLRTPYISFLLLKTSEKGLFLNNLFLTVMETLKSKVKRSYLVRAFLLVDTLYSPKVVQGIT